jgi:hypothetical protein
MKSAPEKSAAGREDNVSHETIYYLPFLAIRLI